MNIGDMAITRAIVYLKPNNATKTSSYEINQFEQNKDFTLDIPLSELFDVTDKAVYPISFDNINIYIETSGMTVSKAYTLAVKDILLAFKDFVISGLSTVKSNNFSIFPNPVTNQTLYLQPKENNSQVLRTEIYSLTGQLLIRQQHGIYHGGVVSVPVKQLNSGTYLLKVYEDEVFSVAKFSVE
jgi:hypothetical protein